MNQQPKNHNKTSTTALSQITPLLPGLILIAGIVIVSTILVKMGIGQAYGLSPLIYAILLGMVVGNTFLKRISKATNEGINFAKSKLLRLGIILYGFNLTINKVWALGLEAIVIDAIMLISTFLLSYYFGTRVLKMDKDTSILSGAGCSICGAAAIMATASVAKARTAAVSQAVTIIVLFGTLAIFIYPLLYPFVTQYITDSAFGVYVGSSVHEVAQVVAIGKVLWTDVADTAILAKMVRVIMLAPFLFVISFVFYSQGSKDGASEASKRIVLPWFAVWFLLMIVLNSVLPLPQELIANILLVDNILLMMAMAGLGLSTQLSTFKAAGPRPFALGLVVFIWLIVVGMALQLIFA